MISAHQIRAARALLGWSQQELADKAIVSVNAIRRLEGAQVEPRMSTVAAVKAALENVGIEFQFPDAMKGGGIRFRAAKRLGTSPFRKILKIGGGAYNGWDIC